MLAESYICLYIIGGFKGVGRNTLIIDYQISSYFGHSRQLGPASTSSTPRYICSRYSKSRSKRYYNHYPLLPGQVPEPSICLRTKYVTVNNNILNSLYQVTVYKTYYYYYSSVRPENPPPSYTAGEIRRDLSPIREESPAPIAIRSGPEEIPPNYTTGELSGESSLVGLVELPDNGCSSRRAFRSLS
jgi:hypothetical protein